MPESSASPHDGSDHESIDLLLSPSDGYFSEGYVHPGEVLVPVPTPGAMTIEKEGKAQQKPRSPSRMNVLQSIRTDIASHPRSPESSKPSILQGSRNLHQPINEYRHLMSSAPPAYSPPESGVLYHQHTRNVTSTGMHESSGRTQLLFPNLMENMGGETTPLLRDYDDKKHWSYRLNEWCRKNSYKVLKYIVLALGIIITISMIVMLAAKLYEKTEVYRPSQAKIVTNCPTARKPEQ